MAAGNAASERARPALDPDKYTIGIVCALSKEADAVQASLDHCFTNRLERPPIVDGDENWYTYGTLAGRYVVLARMGVNKQGGTESGSVAGHMKRTFKNIKLCLVVGITAIIPVIDDLYTKYDALMGDVVISRVVKPYTYGRDYPTGFVPKETYPQGTPGMAHFSSWMESVANREHLRDVMKTHLLQLEKHRFMKRFRYPGFGVDHLYKPEYVHEHHAGPGQQQCEQCSKNEFCEPAATSSCPELKCSKDYLASRERLRDLEISHPAAQGDGVNSILLSSLDPQTLDEVLPMVFHGDIAAGDRVMKNGALRDKLAAEHKVIGFEMEGVGVWDKFPTFVIKAGCDYGDSHKNKKWQEYASMTAAACAKAFLEELQMGIPENVEYGEGVIGRPEAVAAAQKNYERGPTHINNNLSGTFRDSNVISGSTFNIDGDMNIGGTPSRRQR